MNKGHASSGYREFQQCTIDWCHAQLYGRKHNRTKRFLVADEVGLGKTLIAQGLIKKVLEHQASRSIVYVCSSLDIINQNRSKLDPTANASAQQPGRITMIRARGTSRKRTRVYFLTPGTSLFIKNSTGIVEERLYMAWLSRRMFRISDQRAVELFKCNAPSFGDKFSDVSSYDFKPLGKRDFARLKKEWSELSKDIKHGSQSTWRATVTSMRLKLAKIMLQSLKPDLVILDEFQKFKDILMPSGADNKNLCHILVRPGVPTLMLSATPYRLLSRNSRSNSPDDYNHYSEFKDVLAFVRGDRIAAELLIRRILKYGTNVRGLKNDTWKQHLGPLLKEKHEIESDLTRFMSRTERVFFQREEMNIVETRFLSEHKATDRITKDEIREYLLLARDASHREVLGYWKSGSHLLSYLQDYVVGKNLRRNRDIAGNQFMYTLLKGGDARNRKIEYLAKDLFKSQASTLYLWLPPLAPYYSGKGIFSPDSVKRAEVKKGLVFSAWKFVPRLVAAELSCYRDSLFNRKYKKYQMKVTPVTWASFYFPSLELARLLTQDDFSRATSCEGMIQLAIKRLKEKFKGKNVRIHSGARSAKTWELLRHLEYSDDQNRWNQLIRSYKKPVTRTRQDYEHRSAVLIEPRYLDNLNKPFTKDLIVNRWVVRQLAEIAVASPAVTILRALLNVAGPDVEKYLDDINQLSMVELRSFIGRSTTVQCVRSAYKRGSYGHRVFEYFRDGNIQAVLDEYLFCTGGEIDQERLTREQMGELINKLRCVFRHRKSVLQPYKGPHSKHRVNTHVAMAFGESQKEGASRDDLRVAFNSPFWPFILATTSVGQEGLDFHLYCKDIYHWNLPSNPVDLEQREGRLNRYNSLTVRDTVISFDRHKPDLPINGAPMWRHVFERANKYCHYNDRYNLGLSPNWICTPIDGSTKSRFVRHILDLPHSSDRERYHRLMDRLRLYRLALGQPNPDSYLRDLEKNEVLKNIDMRSLYLNLFPFRAIDHKGRLQNILQQQDAFQLLLSDANKKVTQLQKTTKGAVLKRLIERAITVAQRDTNGSYGEAIKRPPLRKLIGAILEFIDVHDAINDRVPVLGYKDDLSRITKALSAMRGKMRSENNYR